MLYDTHRRYGQVAGLVSIPLVDKVGLLDTGIFGESFLNGSVGIVLLCMVGLLGAMFGAEFPDLDSPTSRPSRKYRFLSNLFSMFGVKHRGKFSHDVVVQTLFWFGIYMMVSFLYGKFDFVGSEILFNLVLVYIVFVYIGVLSHLLGDALTVEGVWFGGLFKIKLMPLFIRKFGVGRWKPFKSAFTAGSKWNDMNYKFMTFMLPVSFLYAISQLFEVL